MNGTRDRRRLRHAPPDWQPGVTRVRYTDDTSDMASSVGVFVGNSEPAPGVTPTSWLGVLVKFDGEDSPLDVDPGDLVVVATAGRDPFAGMAGQTPTRYAPGETATPYDYPTRAAWYPVIYYPVGEVVAGEGPIWLVEPYPAARADGTDGLDPIQDDGGASVAVLRGDAAPRPRGEDPLGDWIIPGRALRQDYAYDARVVDQSQLMAAWCEAWAIATALNNGLVKTLGLEPDDIDVLLAAERGDLIGDSRWARTGNYLRWMPIGAEGDDSRQRVSAGQIDRLRAGLAAIEAGETRRPEPSTAARPWTETTFRPTRAGAEMLASIRRQYTGPARCRVCGCTENRACPIGCSWVPDPTLGDLCTACVPDDLHAATR